MSDAGSGDSLNYDDCFRGSGWDWGDGTRLEVVGSRAALAHRSSESAGSRGVEAGASRCRSEEEDDLGSLAGSAGAEWRHVAGTFLDGSGCGDCRIAGGDQYRGWPWSAGVVLGNWSRSWGYGNRDQCFAGDHGEFYLWSERDTGLKERICRHLAAFWERWARI